MSKENVQKNNKNNDDLVDLIERASNKESSSENSSEPQKISLSETLLNEEMSPKHMENIYFYFLYFKKKDNIFLNIT